MMCATCGCSGTASNHLHGHEHPHSHPHEHQGHRAGHESGTAIGTVVRLEHEILARNNRQAEANRSWLAERRILAVNLVSSPGAGKTRILERTLRESGLSISVIEGDQETDNDARRIRAAGARAVQLNTGPGCHLDASMVARGLRELEPAEESVVMIENVGNLVCPALFDLGEHAKVVISSVTEGEDKPVKYPYMFRAGSLVLLNKMDLLPHVDFDREAFLKGVQLVNPKLPVLAVSAVREEGLPEWYAWLKERLRTHAA
jgi:hydrogenase nickel incorporation protein HypB